MTLEQATKTQLDYCLDKLTETAYDWFTERIEEWSDRLDTEQRRNVIAEMVVFVRDDIQHHAEKVIERGFNEGRLEARCRFLTEQWELDGNDIEEAAAELISKAGGKVTLTLLDRNEGLQIRYSGYDDDIMPSELCDYADVPQGSTYRDGRVALASKHAMAVRLVAEDLCKRGFEVIVRGEQSE